MSNKVLEGKKIAHLFIQQFYNALFLFPFKSAVTRMNYVDAVAYCAENEAKLFEPSYKREEMKVIDFYSDSKFKSYWLGATDSTKEGRYVTLINYLCTESIFIKHFFKN